MEVKQITWKLDSTNIKTYKFNLNLIPSFVRKYLFYSHNNKQYINCKMYTLHVIRY